MELMMLIVTILIILTNSAPSKAVLSINYDHMQMIVQWPPTFCGSYNIHCKPQFISTTQFLIHGLWPANPKGDTRTNTCVRPSSEELNEVKKVWTTDKNLKNEMDTYWPSLIWWKNESLWLHEWEKHGYCTKDVVSDVDYFKNAIALAKKLFMEKMVLTLSKGGMAPRNDRVYTVTDLKKLISEKVLPNKNFKVYISCNAANQTHVFLNQIHFCMDKMLKTLISCPPSPDTRGCGQPPKQNNLIIPTKAIYGPHVKRYEGFETLED